LLSQAASLCLQTPRRATVTLRTDHLPLEWEPLLGWPPLTTKVAAPQVKTHMLAVVARAKTRLLAFWHVMSHVGHLQLEDEFIWVALYCKEFSSTTRLLQNHTARLSRSRIAATLLALALFSSNTYPCHCLASLRASSTPITRSPMHRTRVLLLSTARPDHSKSSPLRPLV
jgi:hypothetical protein